MLFRKLVVHNCAEVWKLRKIVTGSRTCLAKGLLGRWNKHVTWWGGRPARSYNDMAEFVHFAVDDLYEKGKADELRRLFQLLEELTVAGDQETRDLIGLGFFETLQNVASWRPYGKKPFEEFLGPMSRRMWSEIQETWRGKSSLADVIRAERKQK